MEAEEESWARGRSLGSLTSLHPNPGEGSGQPAPAAGAQARSTATQGMCTLFFLGVWWHLVLETLSITPFQKTCFNFSWASVPSRPLFLLEALWFPKGINSNKSMFLQTSFLLGPKGWWV